MKPDIYSKSTKPMASVEVVSIPTIEVTQHRYDELIRKETQLEFVKKWLKDKTSYNNYADISDLLLLLDIKKG